MRNGGSLALVAIGAILVWAMDFQNRRIGGVTIDWNVVGYILLGIGLLGVVFGIIEYANENRNSGGGNPTSGGTTPQDTPPGR